jgi:acid phosphatase
VISPLVLYNSVVNNQDRLEKLKNTTLFYEDLAADKLPQWMFITPNMTDDAHDTDVTVAGGWLKNFLSPLTDKRFMDNTLVLITFDENETYSIRNNIFSILIGDSIPDDLVGTSDDNYYNHYSEISTVEANWDLYTLGRWDVGANVFANVAAHTGDRLHKWDVGVPFRHVLQLQLPRHLQQQEVGTPASPRLPLAQKRPHNPPIHQGDLGESAGQELLPWPT